MKAKLLSLLVACGALGGLWASDPALAQKSGGVLRMPLGTSIASVSIHEESTIVVLGPMMGVFNNLVMFDQHGCRRDLCWNLIGAVSDRMRIRGQAARSIGLSASFWVRLCHPSTLRIVI